MLTLLPTPDEADIAAAHDRLSRAQIERNTKGSVESDAEFYCRRAELAELQLQQCCAALGTRKKGRG